MSRPERRARHPRRRARGIEALESRLLLSSTLIPVTDHRDLVVDATRNQLIIVSSTGVINRYDIAGAQLLAPINLNITAGGADISPDDRYLYVTQSALSGSLVLDRVDLSTGATASFSVPISPTSAGLYDCAVLSDGRVELTTVSPGQQQIFVEFDPNTQQFTADPAFTGTSTIYEGNPIFRSADRNSAIFVDPQVSNDPGGVRLLQVPDTESQISSGSLSISSSASAALNPDGSLFALDFPLGIGIFDSTGALVSTLSNLHGGVTFAPDGNILYVAQQGTSTLRRFSLVDPSHPIDLADGDIGETITNVDPFGNGQIAVSPAHTQLFVATASGIRIVDRPGSSWNAAVEFTAPASANFGQQITLSASVASGNPASGNIQPTGPVSFFNESTTPATFLGSASLVNGAATLTISNLPAGTVNLAAIYNGDANFDASPATGGSISIVPITPQLSVFIQNHTANVVGYTTSFTLEVDATASTPVTGTITLTNTDTHQIISVLPLSSGSVGFGFSPPSKGDYHLRADFAGPAGFNPASADYTLIVAQASPAISIVPLSSSFILHAALSTDLPSAPTGTATLLENGQPLLTSPIVNSGADFDLSAFTPGPHTFTVTYSGDSTFLPATSQAFAQVVPINSSVSLTASAPFAFTGDALSLTATVSSAISGSVDFYNGLTLLGTASINAGTATLPVDTSTSGLFSYTAVLNPDGNYLHAAATVTLNIYQHTVLDLLAVYTPQELAAAGSVANILTLLQQQVADTNQAFANSLDPISVRLVGLAPVNYNESGDIDTDWKHLVNFKDHKLDDVPALRDRVGADLVVLLDSKGTPGSAANTELQGEGTQLTGSLFGSSIQSEAAYLVVNINAPESLYDLAHEIGHTLGAAHAPGDPGSAGISTNAYGYRFTGNDGQQYRDIMAYAPGTTIPYFSNPNVLYQGVPVGVAGTSDAADVFLTTAPSVANYRHPSPFGAFTAADGTQVSGWVIDPQNFTGSSTIEIKIDGLLKATIPAADGVASLLSQFGASNHGFTYTLPLLTPGTHIVSVYAIDAATGQPDFVVSDPVTADHLVWSPLPKSLPAGQTLPAPVLTVENAAGQIATDYHSTLTLSILSGPAGGTLTGTTSVPFINGSASFAGLSFSIAGTYTLQVFDGAISANSALFTITPGAATQFSFSTQPPENLIAGSPLAVRVSALDAFGNSATLDRSKVSLTLTGTAGGVLAKPALVSLNKGIAVFPRLSIAHAGTYALTAWSNGQAVATSTDFTVNAAAPAKIIFAGLPSGALVGTPIDPPIVAEIVDRFGNIAATDNAAVTLSLAARPKNAAGPSGTLMQSAAAGTATFGDIAFAAPGVYTLKAMQGKLAGISAKFTIGPAAAAVAFDATLTAGV